MEKLQKNFFFTFSPIPGPNIPKAIKKSKISIIIKKYEKIVENTQKKQIFHFIYIKSGISFHKL